MGKKKDSTQEMTELLKACSAYRVAFRDPEFLDSAAARAIRLQAELIKPEVTFRRNNVWSTIVVFGGTRIEEPKKARAKVRRLETQMKKKPSDKILKRKLAVARSIEKKSHFYDEAREFARMVSIEFQQKDQHHFVIVTGGGPGIMEAANRGAFETNSKSIGLNITLPMEQEPNPYITPSLCLHFHYFAIRKLHFLLRAKALVAFPGGYGTLDELFEALTLVQTGKVRKLPIILFGEKYWKKILNLQALVDEGTIDEEDLELFVYTDTAQEAWEYIKYYYKTSHDPLKYQQL